MKKKFLIAAIIIFLLSEFLIIISPGEIKFIDAKNSPTPTMTSQSKLEIKDLKEGTGKAVKPGDSVVMHYKGMLEDGKEFDSSYKRDKPFETTIGIGQVIKGWDEGVPGMKIGGKRRLVIPAELGYGEQGSPPAIPPNATLIFEMELLEIK